MEFESVTTAVDDASIMAMKEDGNEKAILEDTKVNQHSKPKMNAWTVTTSSMAQNPQNAVKRPVRFSDIMEEQETEEFLESERKEIKNRSADNHDANSMETVEERNLRLAIEASLRESENPNVLKHDEKGTEENVDNLDEEMRLVLAMSLNEAKRNGLDSDMKDLKMENDEIQNNDNLNASTSHDNQIGLSEEEANLINAAIREADDAEHALSIELAMKLEKEEQEQYSRYNKTNLNYVHTPTNYQKLQQSKSNVKVVTRAEYLRQKEAAASSYSSSMRERTLMSSSYDNDDIQNNHEAYYEDDDWEEDGQDVGFRLNTNGNANNPSKSLWSRSLKNNATIIGPNGEVRSKHDVELKSKSNAQRLLSHQKLILKHSDSNNPKAHTTCEPSIGDKAYNDFRKKMKQTKKGVATHGHGRAENMGDEKTRGGALDGNVRMEIQKAINNGIIDRMNGVVKEGKEALVYHADASGDENVRNGVAIKVFKRIQEFRQRGAYVDGDPRYHKVKFGKEDKRNQVEIWTEKEYRNLIRANKAGVLTPFPLFRKQNILFMTFLGEGGWPFPQLREVRFKHKSRKWTQFYCRTLIAVRRLYHMARLIHGDLSEYNILVCPSQHLNSKKDIKTNTSDSLKIVLIDFGQAVDKDHPSSMELLHRDLSRIAAFYKKHGVSTLNLNDTVAFIVAPCEYHSIDGEDLDETCIDIVKMEPIMENDSNVNESTIEEVEEGSMSKVTDESLKDMENEDIQWRHYIPGWDDEKDYDRLFDMISSG